MPILFWACVAVSFAALCPRPAAAQYNATSRTDVKFVTITGTVVEIVPAGVVMAYQGDRFTVPVRPGVYFHVQAEADFSYVKSGVTVTIEGDRVGTGLKNCIIGVHARPEEREHANDADRHCRSQSHTVRIRTPFVAPRRKNWHVPRPGHGLRFCARRLRRRRDVPFAGRRHQPSHRRA